MWTCSRSTRRKRLRPDGEAHMLHDTLGVGRSTYGPNNSSSLSVGRTSKSYPNFVRFLNRYYIQLLRDIPHDDARAKLRGGMKWSSICISQDLQCMRHRDQGNEGMSTIIAFGKFRGGHLRYWEDDMGANYGTTNDLSDGDATNSPHTTSYRSSTGNEHAKLAPFLG